MNKKRILSLIMIAVMAVGMIVSMPVRSNAAETTFVVRVWPDGDLEQDYEHLPICYKGDKVSVSNKTENEEIVFLGDVTDGEVVLKPEDTKILTLAGTGTLIIEEDGKDRYIINVETKGELKYSPFTASEVEKIKSAEFIGDESWRDATTTQLLVLVNDLQINTGIDFKKDMYIILTYRKDTNTYGYFAVSGGYISKEKYVQLSYEEFLEVVKRQEQESSQGKTYYGIIGEFLETPTTVAPTTEVPTTSTQPVTEVTTGGDSPNTGDYSMSSVWIISIVIAVLMAGGITVYDKMHRRRK